MNLLKREPNGGHNGGHNGSRKSHGRASNYGYVAARVKAKRGRLLRREDYLKLLKMPVPAITRFIGELEYREQIEVLAKRYHGLDLLEQALDKNQEDLFGQIYGYAKGELKDHIGYLLEMERMHEVKATLRARIGEVSPEDFIKVSPAKVRGVNERYYDLVGILEADTLEDAVDLLKDTPYYYALHEMLETQPRPFLTSQPLEDAMTLAYYEHLLETVISGHKNKANKLFISFIRKEIDVVNIRTILKAKVWGVSGELRDLIVPGGLALIDDTLEKLLEAQGTKALFEVLATGSKELYDALSELVPEIGRDQTLSQVSQRLDKYLMEEAQNFSFKYPLSILPVLNFIIRKQAEIDNLRIIVRGKQYNLSEGLIHDQLVM